MAGGEYPDGSASKAVWRYDPTLDIWQEVESMQTPRSELGNISFRYKLYKMLITLTCKINNQFILRLLYFYLFRPGIA